MKIKPVKIKLTSSELFAAGMKGMFRNISGWKKGRTEAYGADERDTSWNGNINGVIGEVALAKYLNRYWNAALEDLDAADVDGHQVRTTTWPNGKLILHPEDKDHEPFVLARVDRSVVTLVGWAFAHEGKLEQFWDSKKPKPAFFAPVDILHDMTELPSMSDREAA